MVWDVTRPWASLTASGGLWICCPVNYTGNIYLGRAVLVWGITIHVYIYLLDKLMGVKKPWPGLCSSVIVRVVVRLLLVTLDRHKFGL